MEVIVSPPLLSQRFSLSVAFCLYSNGIPLKKPFLCDCNAFSPPSVENLLATDRQSMCFSCLGWVHKSSFMCAASYPVA